VYGVNILFLTLECFFVHHTDPHAPLLHPQLRSPMMDGLHNLLSGGGKDGRMSIFNMNRPLLGVHSRRTPSRRKFEGEQDAYAHLLPTYAELTARLSASVPDSLRQMFSGHELLPDSPPEKAPAVTSTESADGESAAQSTQPAEPSDAPLSAAKPSAPTTPASATSPTPSASSPAPVSGKSTPKRFSGSVFSKLGNFDPTKVKPPGARPSVTAAMMSAESSEAGSGTPTASGATAQSLPGVIKKEDSVHSPLSQDEEGSPLASANLERATTARTRRAPAKKKFEKPVGEVPPTLEVIPIAPEPTTASAQESTPKASSSAMGALRSLFTARRPTVVATSTSGGAAPGQPGLPPVLQESEGGDSAAPSPTTPGAGSVAVGAGAAVVAGAGITTMLSSLFGSSKGKPKVQTQSATLKGSTLAGMQHCLKVCSNVCRRNILIMQPLCATGNMDMLNGTMNALTSSSRKSFLL
jgi:hypothetical protein